MSNPFNPLDWVKTAQDWFASTERSSGFRPYLIFLIICAGFVLTLLIFFPQHFITQTIAAPLLTVSFSAFILLFAIKSFQDPSFCRSEKHVETVKRIELTQQKGDIEPRPIDITSANVIADPSRRSLPGKEEDSV